MWENIFLEDSRTDIVCTGSNIFLPELLEGSEITDIVCTGSNIFLPEFCEGLEETDIVCTGSNICLSGSEETFATTARSSSLYNQVLSGASLLATSVALKRAGGHSHNKDVVCTGSNIFLPEFLEGLAEGSFSTTVPSSSLPLPKRARGSSYYNERKIKRKLAKTDRILEQTRTQQTTTVSEVILTEFGGVSETAALRRALTM
jgi:hypothetical protein